MNQPLNHPHQTVSSTPFPGQHGGPDHSRERVIALLRDLEARRASLSVRFEHDQEFYQSTLNRMDPSRGWLFISELTPYQGNLRMAAGQQVHLYAVLKESCLHFRTVLLHSGEHDGEAFYVLSVPSELDREQKRTHFRAPVDDASGTPITLINRDGRPFTGHLMDISLGGLKAVFPLKTPIHARDLLTLTKLNLPGTESVECGVQVRFVSDSRETGQRLVGGRFFGLSPEDEQRLLRGLLLMERERLHPLEPDRKARLTPPEK
ncbi:hypothetical protein CKO35_09080 [Ectothiorhodospira shaposhnikovii]|uniref:flagellar brake protein n=1 Tax=Ectothiorhodospira shaposhnikovii TaxID=1054 RepID=UPI00190411D5|nr:flagellar brake protein [Ectothiorhodospira shaposhnikovii]MBK1673460.1 hypothetical protein [Ectothiorhodospira shaposhnikovii]